MLLTGHPSTFQPFNFSTAPQARAHRFSTQRTQSEHKEHNVLPPPVFAFFASSPLCSLCFPWHFPCAPLAPKIFSNHWKMCGKFFQSLEKTSKFFQPLENRPFPGGLPDWPKPGRLDSVPGGQAAFRRLRAAPRKGCNKLIDIKHTLSFIWRTTEER